MSETVITCARHPSTETRLACSSCETPICPRCAVETVVGQKCPDCARQARAAVRQGKPRQYVRGLGAGFVVMLLGAWLLPALQSIPFVAFFAAFGVGFAVGTVVVRGAQGNRNPVFRNAAIAMAAGSIALAYFRIHPRFLVEPSVVLGYLIAGYGAFTRFR